MNKHFVANELLCVAKLISNSIPEPITDDNKKAILHEILAEIKNIVGGTAIFRGENYLQFNNSDKFSMLGMHVETEYPRLHKPGFISLDQIYMHEEWKRKGEQGPATLLYKKLGEIAKKYGDGKLHVYSAGEHSAQKKFWDRVPNVVFD